MGNYDLIHHERRIKAVGIYESEKELTTNEAAFINDLLKKDCLGFLSQKQLQWLERLFVKHIK